MVSNAAQLILKEAEEHGYDLYRLHEHVAVQINDTHPTMVIPELIRLLMQRGFNMDTAIDVVRKTCAYTNHTILAEALEKWPVAYLEKVVPHLMPIIRELDARVRRDYHDERVYIIDEMDRVHMAHIDIHLDMQSMGLQALHTQILEESELKRSMTFIRRNSIIRQMGLPSEDGSCTVIQKLAAYLKELIGSEYMEDAKHLEKLLAYKDDEQVLKTLREIKMHSKQELADYLKRTQHVEIDTNSVI